MSNFYEDNADLRFYLERGIDWEPIVALTEHDFKSEDGHKNTAEAVEFYRDAMDMLGEFVGEEIAPHWHEFDRMKPKLVDGEVVYAERFNTLFETIKEMEVHGLCLPREMGGMNAPLMLSQFMTELFSRAEVSVCAHHGFHGGIALAALTMSVLEGTAEFQEDPPAFVKSGMQDCVDEIVAGIEWGSMDITEPDAGSDMAKLRTKAAQDDDGNWFVTGQKIFITSGHGKWHFVIARTEDAASDDAFAGLKGLSMFLVPAYERNADGTINRTTTELVALEDKMGHNCSATVAIAFNNSPARLVGKPGEGFKYMLMLMNGARLAVGFECLGLCEAAYRAARDYAAERRSMGKTIDKHEMIADLLDEMSTEIKAIRAMAVAASWHEELAQKLNMKLILHPNLPADEVARINKRMKKHKRRARHLTPLLKYTASEAAVTMSRNCIQIHGGNGYMAEYPAEKLLRDSVVMPIYEGTSQIQALMAMKDSLLGVIKNPRRFLARGASARWKSVSARGTFEGRVAKLQHIEHASIRFLLTRIAAGKVGELAAHSPGNWRTVLSNIDPKKDFALAMLHAERLTKILVDVAIAEELLLQVNKFPERAPILEAHLERAEPRCRYMADIISTTGARLLDALAGGTQTDSSAHAAAAK